jgi:hypothetical protein
MLAAEPPLLRGAPAELRELLQGFGDGRVVAAGAAGGGEGLPGGVGPLGEGEARGSGLYEGEGEWGKFAKEEASDTAKNRDGVDRGLHVNTV